MKLIKLTRDKNQGAVWVSTALIAGIEPLRTETSTGGRAVIYLANTTNGLSLRDGIIVTDTFESLLESLQPELAKTEPVKSREKGGFF